jgi:hypothetical protein
MKTLRNMESMPFWAEGVEGAIHLEIESVSGYGCKGLDAAVVCPHNEIKCTVAGKDECCKPGESCIPNAGCTCAEGDRNCETAH